MLKKTNMTDKSEKLGKPFKKQPQIVLPSENKKKLTNFITEEKNDQQLLSSIEVNKEKTLPTFQSFDFSLIWQLLASFLDIKTLVNLSMVNKKIHSIAVEEVFLKYINLPSTNVNNLIKSEHPLLKRFSDLFPIILAINIDSVESINVLIRKGVNLNIKDKQANNPFHYTMLSANSKILSALLNTVSLDKFYNIQKIKDTGLLGIFMTNSLGLTGLDHLQDVRKIEKSICADTAYHKCFEIWKNFLNTIVKDYFEEDYDKFDQYIFKVCMDDFAHPYMKILSLLKQQNEKYFSTYKVQIANSLFLYDGLYDPKNKNRSIFHWVVITGNHRILEILLNFNRIPEYKRNPNMRNIEEITSTFIYQKDVDGNTPLHLAATRRDRKMAKLLIEKGAFETINVKNNHGETPLDIAKSKTNPKPKKSFHLTIGKRFVYYLKSYQLIADFIAAAKNENIASMQELLKKGVHINAIDISSNKTTAIHWVSRSGNEEIVKFLLSKKANPLIKSANGSTAIDWAEKNEKLKVKQLIQDYILLKQEELESKKTAFKIDSKDSCHEQEEYLYAAGDDKNLKDDGDPDIQEQRHYLYSLSDFHILLNNIRETYLMYDCDDGTSYPVKGSDYFGFNRENRKRVFMTDGYHLDQFKKTFKEDIAVITNMLDGEAIARNHGWRNMPMTILIPLLEANSGKGGHWRCIRLQLTYDKTNPLVNVLFDDPYGEDGFYTGMQKDLVKFFQSSLTILFRRQFKDDTFLLEQKHMDSLQKPYDQQGRGLNSSDCGVIVKNNIEDYLKNIDISNENIIRQAPSTIAPNASFYVDKANKKEAEKLVLYYYVTSSHRQ